MERGRSLVVRGASVCELMAAKLRDDIVQVVVDQRGFQATEMASNERTRAGKHSFHKLDFVAI